MIRGKLVASQHRTENITPGREDDLGTRRENVDEDVKGGQEESNGE